MEVNRPWSPVDRMKLRVKPTVTIAILLVLGARAQNRPAAAPTPSLSQSVPSADQPPNGRNNYAGDDTCAGCHQERAGSYHRTAHYLTSRLPSKDSILGDFSPARNLLKTKNPNLYFRMEARSDGFFQTAVQGIEPYTSTRSERFGLVVGSGGKGQTFLFWKGELLFQLPISYWREVGWVNSPGYTDGVAYFDRPVNPRCLECHGTQFESLSPPPNRYRRTGFILGITCEKCHGPGQRHAQSYASKSANVPSAAGILDPARFSRQQQMDLCAWCHAGQGLSLVPSFSYLPGEPLEKYVELSQPDPDAVIDVHGSQIELLEKSRCFQSSTMTCLTCHDVHAPEKAPAAFSEYCLGCHKLETHPALGQPIAEHCVDCHMPKQQTGLIVFDWQGRKISPEVRNHWIKVYRPTPSN